MPSEYEITLTTLVYGGDAMGRLPDPLTGASGRAVFVPYALPGERVRLRLVEEKRGYARAELLEVLEPSPERITPRCNHYFSPLARSSGAPQGCFVKEPGPALADTVRAANTGGTPVRDGRPGSKVEGVRAACGGCHYQHMPYAAQLRAKEAILRDQLERVGHIQNPPVRPIVPSPSEWNYRNYVQFHLTKSGKLGYVGTGARPAPTIIPIAECHLPEPPLNALWPQLEFEPDSGIQRVSMRLGADEDVMLVLESKEPNPPELEIEADVSVVHLYEEDTVVLAGDDHIFINVLGRPFRVSAAPFFQVNTPLAAKIVEHLLTNLPISQSTTLLDVYCGVGLFSAFLAPHVKRLIGIESSPSACEDFAANLDEFDNVELYEGAAEEILPALVGRIGNLTYALVDPPRAGLDRRVIDALLALCPRAIAYVSCDPSTLARDTARLITGGYALRQVTPFDLFPQTYHIESISLFEIK
ncbi:MAG: hypothetical protein C0393_03510 [Anaerolinea sp.]|nr:hypothetical protein [Anaerolinea sp.]